MRLTLVLFGTELDITLGPVEAEPEPCSLDGGTTASTPVGFAQAQTPWEDAGSPHQFDPEDRTR